MSRTVRMCRALLCVLLALMLSLSGVAEGFLTGDVVQAVSEPTVGPLAEEPTVEEPTVEEPAIEEPVAEEPAADAPAVEESVAEEPAADEPVVEEPAVEEPTVEEPAIEESVAEEPAADEPVVDEPVAEEPAADEPAVEEPMVEEPAAGEPAVDDPVVEEPAADEPAVEESVAEEPATDEPAVDEPVAEEPATDEPAVVEPAAEEPVTEETVIEEPVNDETETVIEVPKALTEDHVTEGWNDGHYYADCALIAADGGDGWKYNGSNVYYVLGGEYVRDKVIAVDGAYYAFANDGCMFTNSAFELYDEQGSDWFWYRAKADGRLYVNEWYTEGTKRYYYGEGGKAPMGIATVDGRLRFFEYKGCMVANTTRSVDGVLYVIDGDGVMTAAQEIDGWFRTGDQTYYIENGNFVRGQVRFIADAYYGFDSDGRMYAGTLFNLYDEENGVTDQYRAKANGKLYAGEWYVESYDSFYYGADGRGVSGLQDVSGVTYYFDWNGRICANWRGEIDGVLHVTDDSGAATALVSAGWNKVGENWYYVRNGEIVSHEIVKIGNDYYGFAWDGKMYAGEVFGFRNDETGNSDYYRAKNNGALYSRAWYLEGDDWYYYTEGGLVARGLMTIDGTTYYFDWNGCMFTDRVVTLAGVNYIIRSDGVAIDAGTTDGWKSSGGVWYYVKDGVFVSDEKVLINGKYYYFGSDCTMKSDDLIYIWDVVNDVEICYRAKADGSLYRNEWYRMNGKVQYYGDDAQQVKGICTVGGVPYYFDEWYLRTDTYLSVGGHNYYFNSKGVGRDLGNTDGWLASNGEYLYILNGELVCDGVLEINGSYYAFDNYRMVRNREYYGDDGIYRARTDGKLYVNCWARVGAYWYYYGAEAKALSGLQTIRGVAYYLNDDGKMLTNCVVCWDGVSYLVDRNGVASHIDSNADGWKAVNNNWYYIRNGELVSDEVVLIGDNCYGFDSMGHMYTAGAFSAWSAGNYGVYRVKGSGGGLYRNEWYYTGARYYYYGDDAAMYRNGIYTIKGIDYHFDNGGVMSANVYLSFDGKAYHAEASGKLTALSNGWQQNAQTGSYCYVRDGLLLKSGFYSIDGDMYFFDFNGKMLSNRLIDTWNDVIGCYGYFLIQENGKVYTRPGWIQFGGKWYYVSEGGCLYRGVLNLNGTLYMMDPEMRVMGESVLDADAGVVYALNADGTLKKLTADGLYRISNNPGDTHYCYLSNGKLLKNQWRWISNYWYYFDKSGEACQNGSYEINGARYYFGNDAKMASSRFIVHRDDDNTGECIYYYATQSGALATGKTTIDGRTYYFDRYGEMLNGIVEVDGVSCVFGSDGAMTGTLSAEGWNKAGNDYYYVKNGEVLKHQTIMKNGKLYVLECDGVMACNKIYWYDGSCYLLGADGAARSGWQTSNGKTYYADPVTFCLMDGEDGEVTINGAVYRFNCNAEMIVGDYIQDDMLYMYGADGKKVGEYALNGLTYVNGDVFCYVNGAPYHGWKDGKYYNWDGRMCANGVYAVEEAEHVYKCYFDVYGQPVKGKWIDDRFYARSDGVLACNEWLTIGGVTYYFEGYEKAFGGWYLIDGINYYFDENGKLYTGAGIASGKSDGWVLANGKYYYSKNGYYLANTVAKINGLWYGFDANGVMYSDEVVYLDWQNSGGSGFRNWHYFAAYGAMTTALGWKMLGGEWIYIVEDGEICTEGWRKINGAWYYFDWTPYKDMSIPAIVTGFNSIDGKLYYFESSGALNTAKTPNLTNGWHKADGLWYYFRNGKLVRNCICTINGKVYGFDHTGAMLCDGLVMAHDSETGEDFYYVTDSNGCVITTPGWIDVWDSKAYVGVNGRLYCNGLYLIDGVQHAFNGVGLLIEA